MNKDLAGIFIYTGILIGMAINAFIAKKIHFSTKSMITYVNVGSLIIMFFILVISHIGKIIFIGG